MRRYAPHHTHVQSWSGSTRPYTQSQKVLSTLQLTISQLFSSAKTTFNIVQVQTAIPPSSTHDDVYAEARLEALRRWLDISAPLSQSARAALCMLMRPSATIVRRNHTLASSSSSSLSSQLCKLCAAKLQSSPSSLLKNDSNPLTSHVNSNDQSTPITDSNNNNNNQRNRTLWLFCGDLFWTIVSITLFWLLRITLFFLRFVRRIHRRSRHNSAIKVTKSALEDVMAAAPYYSAWYNAAINLDQIEGNHAWKSSPDGVTHTFEGLCNDCHSQWHTRKRTKQTTLKAKEITTQIDTVCDVDMLAAKLRELSVLYNTGDIRGLAFSLRANLVRNLAGMCHPELHSHSRVGTNLIVEDYVNVVSYLLAYIAEVGLEDNTTSSTATKVDTPEQSPLPTVFENTSKDNQQNDPQKLPDHKFISSSHPHEHLSIDDKLTFLNEARHAYGRTALMLSGGATMGLNHLGVVKGLLHQGLLPKVVCGTSAGALVASMVGTFDDEQLNTIFDKEILIHPVTKQPFSFRYYDYHTTILGRLRRFIRKGFIQDVKMLQDCLRKNFGDLTFEEAYTQTRRILNITVCPSRRSSDPPLLLNYLTAPHVLIWSAAAASCALPLVFAPVELFAKSANGRLVPYHPDGVRWIDGSITSDVPLSRIGELFNVNHFIVSQTNPHVIPRSMPILQTRIALLLKSELQFRYWQALQMGLVPKLLTAIFPHFMQPYAGDVTIMPDIRFSDLTKLLRNPTEDEVIAYVRRGELQTFPFLDRIRLHCLIEQTLDTVVEHVATVAKGEEYKHAASSLGGKTLFGRVPSWLWLDTRSILTSGPMSAVASRLSAAMKTDKEQKETIQDTEMNNETNGDSKSEQPSGFVSLTKRVKQTLSSTVTSAPVPTSEDKSNDTKPTKLVYQDLDDIFNQLEQDESDSIRLDSQPRRKSSGSVGSGEFSEEDRVLC